MDLDARVHQQQAQELQDPGEEVDAALILQRAVPVAHTEAHKAREQQVACGKAEGLGRYEPAGSAWLSSICQGCS